MPRLKQLSGIEVIKILESFGFEIYTQKGSHIKLRRNGVEGNQTLIVPNHNQLDTGTCRAIFRQATRYVSENELFPHFYSK